MSKYIISLCLLLSTYFAHGHQPDISSTMLVEQENGHWLLQVRASLTAFQYEIRNHYGENSYDSPEKFKDLVVEHIMQNFVLTGNDKDSIQLQNGYVKLGHETNVVFEMMGMPKDLDRMAITHKSFSNIHRNQSILLVLKQGVAKDQFILNESNDHTALLTLKDNRFVIQSLASNPTFFPYGLIIGVAMSLTILCIYIPLRRKLKMSKP